jgi:hypothetical protein
MVKRIVVFVAVLLAIYIVAYGVARWRKFIVMHETDLKEEQLLARFTERGWDVRDNWRGHTKNQINPYLVTFFRPLEYIEDACRGFRRPLRPPQQKQSQ